MCFFALFMLQFTLSYILISALDCNYRSIYEPSLYAAEDVMYAFFELDEHYNMPLYEVANPEDPTEKHIAVGFDYSLLDDFLNTWKKKKEDLASGKITKEEYLEWKINWPHTEDQKPVYKICITSPF